MKILISHLLSIMIHYNEGYRNLFLLYDISNMLINVRDTDSFGMLEVEPLSLLTKKRST